MRVWCGAVLAAALLLPGQAAHADPAAVFARKCRVCHRLGEGAVNSVGPQLNGVVGRPAASVQGYPYSAALRASGLTWNEATLDAFLTRPRDVVAGTSMTFAGMVDPAERAGLIAWLKHYQADGSVVAPAP